MKDNKIKQLDKDISNKIAAGEVVERPLAVVKELVENAIDAGATKITVEINDAGKSLIRVTDNGQGILPEDVLLAFERHSTSKIRTINDIYHIASLGFRGEALASIASVSIVELITKHVDYDMGQKAVLEGGHVVEHTPIGAPQGTTIMVKDLFYNTPARLKFMKSNHAEQNAINDIMNKLALSHPEIAFKYIVGGHNIFMSPGNGQLYDVILNIYERRIGRNLLDVIYTENDIHVKGFISTIEMTRGNKTQQIAFVNNRYVKSDVVDQAVNLAYRTLIPHNRFPIVFLNLEIDPSLVDINIHPAKTEIRFHQEGLVKDLIYKSLSSVLNQYNLTPSKELNAKPIEPKQVLRLYDEINEKAEGIKESPFREEVKPRSVGILRDEFHQTPSVKEESKVFREVLSHLHESVNAFEPDVQPETFKKELSFMKEKAFKEVPFVKDEIVQEKEDEPIFSKSLKREAVFVEQVYEPAKSMFEKEESSIYDHLIYKGNIFQTYLIFEKDSTMYLIDQHAAHEKILFEDYVQQYRNKKMMSQMILEPITVHVNYMEKGNLLAHEDDLSRLGFIIDDFGEDTVIVREIPSMMDIRTAEKMIQDLIEKLDFSLPEERFHLALDDLMQASCKAAIKANDRLDTIEVNSLIKQLKGLKDPYTCPHGRPIIITIGKSELEKKFNRT
ncbi:MAG: DNA mismatch repair endonuclease MutL [Clostridia bacterium]|nr:DNA mismatch repair endonuclease MutL [Clostridia bacterium]